MKDVTNTCPTCLGGGLLPDAPGMPCRILCPACEGTGKATPVDPPGPTGGEPAWAEHLRVIAGLAGILRSHAENNRLDRETALRLAARLEAEVAALAR